MPDPNNSPQSSLSLSDGTHTIISTVPPTVSTDAPVCSALIVVISGAESQTSMSAIECSTTTTTGTVVDSLNSSTSTPSIESTPTTLTESSSETSSPAVTSASAGSNHGVSGGAVAGAAIGSLLAGALITAVVCFLLYRRQKRRQPKRHGPSQVPYDGNHKTSAAVAMTSIPVTSRVGRDFNSHLPQPADDGTITRELSKVRDSIKNHVFQTQFYHFQPVYSDIDRSTMESLATATGMSAYSLTELFKDTSTRGDAIRLFVAWSILSRCESGSQQSLLPPGMGLLQETILGKEQSGSESGKSALMFSKWKVLTGVLLGQQYGGRTRASIGVSASIIDEMDLVLKHFFADGIDAEKRRRNLELIISRAARHAFLLFSQPGSFHFDFSGGRNGLVVFPALVQVVGDQAQALNPPRILLHTELASDAA